MNSKNGIYAVIVCLTILGASCKKSVVPLSKQELQHRIDSITEIRLKETDDHARRDLQHRLKIESKYKADSILEVWRQEKARKTTPVPETSTPPAPETDPQQ